MPGLSQAWPYQLEASPAEARHRQDGRECQQHLPKETMLEWLPKQLGDQPETDQSTAERDDPRPGEPGAPEAWKQQSADAEDEQTG